MNIFNLSSTQWTDLIISLLIIFLTALLAKPFLNLLLGRILKRLTKSTKTSLDDVLVDAIRPPLFWFLLIFAFQSAINRLDFISFGDDFKIADVYYVFYFLIVFFVVIRVINAIIGWYTDEIAPKTESNLDEQLLPFFRRVFVIIIVVIAGIIFLGRFNVEVGGLVTTLGIGSLAIALAAQSALSDTIGGFMIMLDRPFRIGDRIEIQDLGTWGDVVDVGLRSTHIRTRDNRTVIVPNSVIIKSLIVNHSYPDDHYRIQIEIGVAYGSDIKQARQTIITAVKQVEGVMQDKPVEALFLAFADSTLTFRVRWWLESYVDTRRMFDKVNTAMYEALNEAGIELPFPQRDLHHRIDEETAKNLKKVLSK